MTPPPRFGASKSRSTQGCYTCRLRRKKCDEKKPECDNCTTLEIKCWSSEEKPDWFDGGPKQKAEMAKVKADIRIKAGQRRDRKYLEMMDKDSRETSAAASHDGSPEHDRPMTADIAMSGASSHEPDEVQHGSSHAENSTPASTWSNTSFPLQRPQTAAFLHDESSDIDMHYIMIFLDSIFPYLFPYYHPFVLAGGKGWVLQSLIANRAVYHTSISLASYFFGILLGNQHTACSNAMVEKLQTQIELGLRELRNEMGNLRTRPPCLGNVEALNCMQSIVLMCHFEVATGNVGNWVLHLDAATAMLQQLVPSPDNWGCVLDSFDSGQFDAVGLQKPFTAHQNALRFYAAQCLYMDVLASITLSRVPRLHSYQPYLMPGCTKKPPNTMRTTMLFLDEFLGLHNSTLQLLSDVAALDAWKKEQRKAGSLSIHELLAKATTVGDAIKVVVEGLEEAIAGGYETCAALFAEPFDILKELQPQSPDDLPGHPTHNLIWLLAAQTQLHLVVSGWQPSCPEISRNVKRMTELFTSLPRPTALRSMALPLCVAGCLVGPDQEHIYRALVENMGSLRVFGTVKESLAIMEAVWAKRETIDESWDMSKCLNILGHGVLLI